MKKFLCVGAALSGLCFLNPLAAAHLNWVGNDTDPELGIAPYGPIGGGNALFPTTSASGNTVEVSGGSIPKTGTNGGFVFGGSTSDTNATANHNQVTVSGENTSVNIAVFGGASESGEANHNTVTITNGTIGWLVAGGSSSSGEASYNTVQISGGEIPGSSGGSGSVYGGWSQNSALVQSNQVTVSGGNMKEVVGGSSYSGTVAGNRVNISGGTVTSRVYGGHSLGSGTISNNIVEISGGTISGSIYGGFSSSGDVTGNTVIISGNPTLTGAEISGGFSSGDVSGNSLRIETTDLAASSLSGFDRLEFSLTAEVSDDSTLLTLTNGSGGNNMLDLSGVTVEITGVIDGVSPLQQGDAITLVDSSVKGLSGALANDTTSVTKGSVIEYFFDLSISDGKLLATLAGPGGLSEQSKSFAESFLSGLAILGQASDTVAGLGINSALQATAGANGLAGFGGISGGKMRYSTGSHIKMDSYSLLAGLARQWDSSAGQFTAGAFLEYGDGSYDTYNSFAAAPEIRGKGDSYYLGGGALARMSFVNTAAGQPYLEASFRAGSVDNDYAGSGYSGGGGRVSYNYDTAYFGMHMGAGYRWNVREDVVVDFFGKTFWTRQRGKSVISSAGDHIRFDDADSLQTRLGLRAEYQLDTMIQLYASLAWEHEFCGDATGSVENFSLAVPSLQGNNGIGELGLTLRPLAEAPHLSLTLGAQGYVGKRQGVTGHGQVRYEF